MMQVSSTRCFRTDMCLCSDGTGAGRGSGDAAAGAADASSSLAAVWGDTESDVSTLPAGQQPQAIQSPCRTQAKIYRLIAVTSAINTHCTMAWSIHEPGGGAPGRMLRSGTIANRFAAYHVANGG